MPEIPDHARKTLDDLLQDVNDLIAKLYDAVADMNRIERRYGAQPTALMDLLSGLPTELGGRGSDRPSSGANTATPAVARPSVAIRVDQYLGWQPLDAAKAYLSDVGYAVQFDEIADAVARGGAAVRGADWREALETSLIRSTNDVIKVQEHVFGLIRFYSPEKIAGLRATRRQATAKPPRKIKKKLKPKVKFASVAARTKVEREKEPPRSAASNGSGPIAAIHDPE